MNWRVAGSDVRSTKIAAAFASENTTNTHANAPQHTTALNTFAPAGQPRASFEIHNLDEELRIKLGATRIQSPPKHLLAQNHLVQPREGPPRSSADGRASLAEEREAYEQWRAQHPCVLQRLDEIMLHLRGKRLAVFLDYDGTLTPIVSNPDEAFLSPQMRDVIRNVARLFPTAIISGRGREKVENFVQLRELYYAGSHGMDIAGPTELSNGVEGGSTSPVDMAFQPAAHFKPLIDAVYKELCERLASIPGSSVEHNNFCVSAHFRNCSQDRWQEVVAVVEEIVARNPELRMTRGRKVVEVRPKVNWHKGTALDHLLGVLSLRGCSDVVAIYIGDDHTDEDAFRVLRESRQGFGILVSTKVRETSAAYTVRDPSEVQLFLQALVTWGLSDNNGWASFAHRANGSAPESAAANNHGQLSLSTSPALQAAVPSS